MTRVRTNTIRTCTIIQTWRTETFIDVICAVLTAVATMAVAAKRTKCVDTVTMVTKMAACCQTTFVSVLAIIVWIITRVTQTRVDAIVTLLARAVVLARG